MLLFDLCILNLAPVAAFKSFDVPTTIPIKFALNNDSQSSSVSSTPDIAKSPIYDIKKSELIFTPPAVKKFFKLLGFEMTIFNASIRFPFLKFVPNVAANFLSINLLKAFIPTLPAP